MPLKKIPLIYIFLTCLCNLQAQQFPIQKLTEEDGLGHSIVYRTYQTSNGYLWFSTDNGLTRFDGVSLANYTSNEGLASNFIFGVKEWKQKLYIASFGSGIMVMDSGSFKPILPADIDQPLYPLDLLACENELWVIDRYKLLHRYNGARFTTISPQDLMLSAEKVPKVHRIQRTSDGGVYLATLYGLYYFKDGLYKKIAVPGLAPDESIMTLVVLKDNNLMLTTEHKLLEFDVKHNTVTPWLVGENFSPDNCLFQDTEGNIWVSTTSAHLLLCQKTAEGTKHIIKALEGTVINEIYQDREKNIWLSTYGEGAWCIRSLHVRNYAVKGCIVSDMILNEQHNNLIITTFNAGIKLFKQNDNRYLTDTISRSFDRFFKHRKLLVTACALPDGSSLFSSDSKLYKWKDGKIDSLQAEKTISSLYFQQKKTRLWIGSRAGLGYTDPDLSKFTPAPGFEGSVIRSIIEDADGNILAGTDIGVFIEHQTGFKLLPGDAGQPYHVNALFREKGNGKIWVGTNQGLAIIENNRLKPVNHPLAKVRCNAITADHKGNLWIGTVNGLLLIHQHKFEMITPKEGIAQSNVIKVIFDDKKGTLAVLTPNAISVIDTEKFLKRSTFQLPDILIEKVLIENRSLDFTTQPIPLGNAVKDLTILVSSPLVKNRDKISFSYKLNDQQWIDFNGQKINLHSLPYGDLTITVRIQEQFRPAISKSSSISFTVAWPFYLTWWFIGLIGLATLGLIYWVVNFYSRKKNIRLVAENKRLDVEHKALRNLLNPHFLYNAINSIHAFILQNDQRKTLAYLAKFSQLVRLNLELLATDRVALDKEIKNISLYLEFEKLRFADKLNYDIQIDPAIAHSEIQIPSFIIQPFLENAIWHGLLPRPEGGNLLLQVRQQEGKLIITIDDNGVGINASLKNPKQDLDDKTSMGINIIKERIELMNKLQGTYGLIIVDKSELTEKSTGTGTLVRITVPVNYN